MLRMKNILISVIVPIYNVAAYLCQCVDSIRLQTYANLEIILVDDGSTDEGGAICDTYASIDSRIIVVHKENGGLVSARKAGLNIATGSYIAFVDGDDWILPEMYEELLSIALKTDADIVESGYVNQKNKIDFHSHECIYKLSDEMTIKNIIEDWLADCSKSVVRSTIWSKLYRVNLIKEAYSHVPNQMNFGEDWIAFLWLIKLSNFISVTEMSYYCYRVRNDSISHIYNYQYYRKAYELYSYVTNFISENYPYVDSKKLDLWFLTWGKMLNHQVSYGNGWDLLIYQFPSPEMLNGKKIILYGAGNVGRDYYKQLSIYENIDIVAWVDQAPDKYNYEFYDIKDLDVGFSQKYDFVLLAVLRENLAEAIRQEIVEQRDVPADSIIWKAPRQYKDELVVHDVGYNIVKIIGGLGNQMFQYSLYRAMQEKGIDTRVNLDDFSGYKRKFEIQDVFKGTRIIEDSGHEYDSYKMKLTYHGFYQEKVSAEYDASVFNMRDTSFSGYWQTEKYFKDIEEIIRQEFIFNVSDEELANMAQVIMKENSVSIHIRRGDYLETPDLYCGICSVEYYKKAIKYMIENANPDVFYVFSDDLNWVRENLDITNAVYVDSLMFDHYENWYDMYLMSCCKHNIIANSSFSWWGAWLNNNKNKIIIAPKLWLNGEETKDIWCDGWIKI